MWLYLVNLLVDTNYREINMDVVKVSLFLVGSSFLPIILFATSKWKYSVENILENRTNVKYQNPLITFSCVVVLFCVFATYINYDKEFSVLYLTLIIITILFLLKDIGVEDE